MGKGMKKLGRDSHVKLVPTLTLSSYSPSSFPSPGGLLPFMEGAIREVGRVETFIISQDRGPPSPGRGLDSCPQSVPGRLLRTCRRENQIEVTTSPGSLGALSSNQTIPSPPQPLLPIPTTTPNF